MANNYGTMDKTMVLWGKKNYGTMKLWIYEGQKLGRLPKTTKLRFIMEEAILIYQNI